MKKLISVFTLTIIIPYFFTISIMTITDFQAKPDIELFSHIKKLSETVFGKIWLSLLISIPFIIVIPLFLAKLSIKGLHRVDTFLYKIIEPQKQYMTKLYLKRKLVYLIMYNGLLFVVPFLFIGLLLVGSIFAIIFALLMIYRMYILNYDREWFVKNEFIISLVYSLIIYSFLMPVSFMVYALPFAVSGLIVQKFNKKWFINSLVMIFVLINAVLLTIYFIDKI
jgi:hypothetical protein